MSARPRSIGIDLGTTNSCVATIDEAGRPQVIVNRQGERTLPSVVSFVGEGDGRHVLVGAPAPRQAVLGARSTIHASKRLIGRRLDDPEVQRLAATLPYQLAAAPNGDAWVSVDGEIHSPQEIASHVLVSLRQVAEEHFGGEVVEAIITVPAYFDHAQRRATQEAAQIAGLRVRRLLNEPTAAALGYGAHREPAARFAVCDLGGGTFDVSIVNVEDGVFEVISTHGDILLGGEDLDRRVMARLAEEIGERHGLEVGADPTALQRLRDEVERAKQLLSEAAETTIQIPYLGLSRGQPLNYERVLRRAELEEWTADIVDRLEPPCRAALANAGLCAEDVDQVLLVGGQTRMPAVARKIEQIFGRRPAKNAHPDEAVAIGAATQCAILDGQIEDVVLLDVTSRTLGLHAGGGRFAPVIPRNATIPTREERIVATTAAGQREIRLEVFEGESPEVRDNRRLGAYVVEDLPEAPAGEVLIFLGFDVDVNGILRLSARDLLTGQAVPLRVAATCGLTGAQVARLSAACRART